mgnify:CR=1 FL=1
MYQALVIDKDETGYRASIKQLDDDNLQRAPVGRSLLYAGIGLVAAIWALASLISG